MSPPSASSSNLLLAHALEEIHELRARLLLTLALVVAALLLLLAAAASAAAALLAVAHPVALLRVVLL
eukprot:4577155-Pyramimonas_sp.AAC.1